jgi:hypothetical protein
MFYEKTSPPGEIESHVLVFEDRVNKKSFSNKEILWQDEKVCLLSYALIETFISICSLVQTHQNKRTSNFKNFLFKLFIFQEIFLCQLNKTKGNCLSQSN